MSIFDDFIETELDTVVLSLPDEQMQQTVRVSDAIESMEDVPLEVLMADLTPVEIYILTQMTNMTPVEALVKLVHILNGLYGGEDECLV